MAGITAPLDWAAGIGRQAGLGLIYRHEDGQLWLGATCLGAAPDEAAARQMAEADLEARVLASLSAGARAALSHGPRYRHKKRGSSYCVLGRARLQTGAPLEDDAPLVIYRAEGDGALWARPVPEFEDGRFEALPDPAPITASAPG